MIASIVVDFDLAGPITEMALEIDLVRISAPSVLVVTVGSKFKDGMICF